MSATDADMEDAIRRRGEERLGVTLNQKYRLDRVLGAGGMAVVYEATHRNQKQFAVKMLHPELAMRPDIRARFLREGYAANSVKHPGAVAVLDDDVASDGAAFLVMELLDGAPLENVCAFAGGRLGAEVVLAIAFQVADVLVAAHAKDIVHRDIKPANLFLVRDGQIKVLDFGIARVRDAATGGSGGGTGSGFMLGTPAFMAPEQANSRSNDVDGQTDVWAIGATMFTLLTGRTVHVADNAGQLLIAAATQPAPALRDVAPEMDEGVAALVDRALARDKSARWAAARDLRDAIGATHARLFARPPSAARLAELLALPGAAPSSRADTVASGESTAPSPVGSTPEVVLRIGGSERASGDSSAMADTRPSDDELERRARSPVVTATVGLSTAEPVSSTARRNATTARPPARSRTWLAAVALLSLFAIGVAAVRLRSGGDEGTHAAPSSLGAASLVAATASTDLAVPAPAPSNPKERATPAASMSSTLQITRPASAAKGETLGVRRPPSAPQAPPSAAPCKLVVKQTGIDPDGQPHFAKVCE